jgi:hypothetical protein
MAKQKTSRRKERAQKILLHFADLERAGETAESGMFVDKKDAQVIYHALKAYKPLADEEVLHDTLLETFEELLVVDFGEKPTRMN